MTRKKQDILDFIIQNLQTHPKDIVRFTSEKFGVSRQVVNRHLGELVEQGKIAASGRTRRTYALLAQENRFQYEISPGLEEDRIWRNDVAPLLRNGPQNVMQICQYGVTEIINNAIDHSEGQHVFVKVAHNPVEIAISISDDGIGIFKKIKSKFALDDERHAILELAKGKLTTDPQRHSGEGIFFTSRMFDQFTILSGALTFTHTPENQDWLMKGEPETELEPAERPGTVVLMKISVPSDRKISEILNRFASGKEDFGFTRTIVPVRLARYGDENLVSRSQARRMLARIERFREVILDFAGVNLIGQAFADEVFRVWQNAHPEVKLIPLNINPDVSRMILRAVMGN